MGCERIRKLLFESPYFRSFIKIFFAAVIAPDREGTIEVGTGAEGISLAKGNSVSKEEILSKVKPIVLAEYHPTIMVILPHTSILQAIRVIGRGNQRRE
jgi:hypothetical protein